MQHTNVKNETKTKIRYLEIIQKIKKQSEEENMQTVLRNTIRLG